MDLRKGWLESSLSLQQDWTASKSDNTRHLGRSGNRVRRRKESASVLFRKRPREERGSVSDPPIQRRLRWKGSAAAYSREGESFHQRLSGWRVLRGWLLASRIAGRSRLAAHKRWFRSASSGE